MIVAGSCKLLKHLRSSEQVQEERLALNLAPM